MWLFQDKEERRRAKKAQRKLSAAYRFLNEALKNHSDECDIIKEARKDISGFREMGARPFVVKHTAKAPNTDCTCS
ncbi:MAG: hypothetical protein R3346_02620 [Candidatus Spechtbacterales bacterium]|nr:hypothetical protein [Candidatus Spechtbacterales bacterium]